MKKIKNICLLLAFVILFAGCSSNSAFYIKNEEVKTINGNLHYSENLIERKLEKEEVDETLNRFELLSDYLKELNHEAEFLIENINYVDGSLVIEGCQYYDGVAVSSVQMFFDVSEDEVVKMEDIGSPEFINNGIIEERNILNIKDYYSLVLKKFDEHKSEITFIKELKKIPVVPEIIFNEDGYFFMFTTKHNSYIKIDAVSGEVLEEYYFNGIYY